MRFLRLLLVVLACCLPMSSALAGGKKYDGLPVILVSAKEGWHVSVMCHAFSENFLEAPRQYALGGPAVDCSEGLWFTAFRVDKFDSAFEAWENHIVQRVGSTENVDFSKLYTRVWVSELPEQQGNRVLLLDAGSVIVFTKRSPRLAKPIRIAQKIAHNLGPDGYFLAVEDTLQPKIADAFVPPY